jgi:hypothetical protein
MTTPQPLSPDAQAVLDAANGASSWGPDDVLNDAPFIAVAVLRAVSQHMHKSKAKIDVIIAELEKWHSPFVIK